MPTKERVKLAIVGGKRGAAYGKILESFKDRVELTAICDHSEATLNKWKENLPGVRAFTSFDHLLAADVSDAIALATPLPQHAAQSVEALKAGKHVISEISAATTIDECWQLVDAVTKSGRVYMMAENYCYARNNMMVLNMVQQDVFGEISYAEGGYIHDTRDLSLTPDGEITWRGMLRQLNGNTYPTHALGPIAQWLGAVHGGTDRLATTASFTTSGKAMVAYARERLGANHPNARKDLWTCGDSVTTIIQTEKGALIVLRRDSGSPRPRNAFQYELQGTKAAFLTGRSEKEEPVIWIEGVSPGKSPGDAEWEPLSKYSERYEHPRWCEWNERASQAGHGGGDFFIVDDFLNAIQNGTKPGVDVYDAVTWSAIMPLSIESVARGNVPVDIPDFTKG